MQIKRRFLCAIVSLVFAFSAQAETLEFSGYGMLRDMDCGESSVIVEGMKHGLNFSGYCVEMTVSGVENEVDFETAGMVNLFGATNLLKGALAGAAAPSGVDVMLSGADNVLTLRFDRPAVVEIAGSGNRLVWTVAPGVTAPEIRIIGENNSAEAQ